MPPKPTPVSSISRRSRWRREAALVWRSGWDRLRSRLWIIAVSCGLSMAFVLLNTGLDPWVGERLRVARHSTAHDIASGISAVADLELALPLALALWAWGTLRNRARLRRLAWACLMATCIAGAMASVLKFGVGRPRPSAELSDGFYGPTLESDYLGFPSGHAATTFGTLSTFVPVAPIIGASASIYAGAVGWSRLSRERHFLTDVLAGAIIGIVCGLSFAGAVPGMRWKLKRRRRRPT